jgi:hypothetical protein
MQSASLSGLLTPLFPEVLLDISIPRSTRTTGTLWLASGLLFLLNPRLSRPPLGFTCRPCIAMPVSPPQTSPNLADQTPHVVRGIQRLRDILKVDANKRQISLRGLACLIPFRGPVFDKGANHIHFHIHARAFNMKPHGVFLGVLNSPKAKMLGTWT